MLSVLKRMLFKSGISKELNRVSSTVSGGLNFGSYIEEVELSHKEKVKKNKKNKKFNIPVLDSDTKVLFLQLFLILLVLIGLITFFMSSLENTTNRALSEIGTVFADMEKSVYIDYDGKFVTGMMLSSGFENGIFSNFSINILDKTELNTVSDYMNLDFKTVTFEELEKIIVPNMKLKTFVDTVNFNLYIVYAGSFYEN